MYMSPEQARAQQDIDGRADVWSLGVVLYEMLTGERPFSGETAEVVFKITHGEIPRASRRLRRLDPALDDLVAGCLTRDRSQRTESADAVARQLEAHTSPAARKPLPSLMDIGLGDLVPSAMDPGSGNAAFSPGTGPTPLGAASSPGLSSLERERSSSRHPAVSRSGSRPLSGSGSQSGGLVDQDAATQPLSPGHLAPSGRQGVPEQSSSGGLVQSDDEAMYGPRGTMRIDPGAVQAAIDAHRANRPRAGQGTMPMLQMPPLAAPPTIGATMPLPPPNAALVTSPVASAGTTDRKRTVLWVALAAILMAVVLAVVAWFVLRPGQRDGGAPPVAMTEAPPALPAPTRAPSASATSAEMPAPVTTGVPTVTATSSVAAPAPPATSSTAASKVPSAPPIAHPGPTTNTGARPSASSTSTSKCKSKFGVGCK
jgi:serine/threonine-protein kinase